MISRDILDLPFKMFKKLLLTRRGLKIPRDIYKKIMLFMNSRGLWEIASPKLTMKKKCIKFLHRLQVLHTLS